MNRALMRTTILLAWLACPLVAAGQAPGTPSKPSAYALPEQTVAVVRLPNAGAYFAAMRRQTRLGNVLLSDERQQKLVQLFQEMDREGWGKLMAGLARFNLQPDDWKKLFAAEAGMALVLETRGDLPPMAVILAWLEPGEDLAGRLLAAMQKAIAEAGPDAPRRTDLNLAGYTVMQIAEDVEGSLTEESDASDEEEAEAPENAPGAEGRPDVQLTKVDEFHLFVTRAGGRLLMGVAVPQSDSYVRRQLLAQQPVDWTGVISDPARTCFARFLAAHKANDSGVLPRLLATPGLAQALPDGLPLVELVINPAPLWKLLDRPEAAEVRPILEQLGVTKLGPVAMRMTLDGTTMREGLFVSLPSPRTGLCALLDQTPIPAEPPAWLVANATGFSVMGLDLGKVYATAKQIALEMAGPQAQQVFAQIEGQVQIQLQAGPADVLGALGNKITTVTFPPKKGNVTAPEAAETFGLSDRVAMVWQVRDPAICSRLMQFIQALAPSTQGIMSIANEQGFSGVRIEPPGLGVEMGLFYGKGHLLFGIGAEVCETVMAVISSPPQGDAAFSASPHLARARELIAPEPAFSYSVSDLSHVLSDMREMLLQMLESPAQALPLPPGVPGVSPEPLSPEQAALMQKLKELIPSAKELEGALGVSTSLLLINSQGIVARSATELPAP